MIAVRLFVLLFCSHNGDGGLSILAFTVVFCEMPKRKRGRARSSSESSWNEDQFRRTVEGDDVLEQDQDEVQIVEVGLPLEYKNNCDPSLGGMSKDVGGLAQPVTNAVDGAASVGKISVNASVGTSLAAVTRSPDMPLLESEMDIPRPPECRAVRDPPPDDGANDNFDAEEGSSSFPLHLVSDGLTFHVLEVVMDQGHLLISNQQLNEISRLSAAAFDNRYKLTVIVFSVQALALTLDLDVTLRRWAKGENLVFSKPLTFQSELPRVQPWDNPYLGSNNIWSPASRIASRFASQKKPPTESRFHADLTNCSGHQPWVIPLIVSTLFVVKDSSWFWPVLLSYRAKERV